MIQFRCASLLSPEYNSMPTRSLWRFATYVSVSCGSLLGCSAPEQVILPAEPYTVIIQTPKVLLESREILSLAATVVTRDGSPVSNQTVSWSSSNEAVASVSAGGVLSAKSIRGGVTEWVTIRASAATVSGEIAVGVRPVNAASVKIRTIGPLMYRGDSAVLSAEVLDSTGSVLLNRTITWSVSDSSVGFVSSMGTLIARKTGLVRIRAAIQMAVDSAAVAIVEPLPLGAMPSVISAGRYHTCAIRIDDVVVCWGANGTGQLGDGRTLPIGRSSPLPVLSPVGFSQVSLGFLSSGSASFISGFSCAISTSREGWCWGDNQLGSIGDGTRVSRLMPMRVAGGLEFVKLASGYSSTCGVAVSGKLFCWGGGYGDTILVPTAVQSPEIFRDVASRWGHFCALNMAGRAFCWGYNDEGQLGDGTYMRRSVPTPVLGDLSFSSVVTGYGFSCGLTGLGKVYCWGSAFFSRNQLAPTAVNSAVVFSSLTAGMDHVCGLSRSGQVYCWGEGRGGQLGNGASGIAQFPTAVLSDQAFSSLSAGFSHTCGITLGGTAYCWGSNVTGQLGIEVSDSLTSYGQVKFVPSLVVGGHRFRSR